MIKRVGVSEAPKIVDATIVFGLSVLYTLCNTIFRERRLKNMYFARENRDYEKKLKTRKTKQDNHRIESPFIK